MPSALLALAAFIAVIIVWSAVFKRNMGEAMFLGFIATCLFAGGDFFGAMVSGLVNTTSNEVIYAALAFVFMAYMIERTGLINKILDILNAALGRLRGGPAYVDIVASGVMGALSGSNSGNVASTGSVTGPWMVRNGFSRARAATILAGNGGMGAALPPSSSMVIMLGFAGAAVSTGDIYLALLVTGLYQVLHRLVVAFAFIRVDGVRSAEDQARLPFGRVWRTGWPATLIYLGALIPIAVTTGPLSEYLGSPDRLGDALGDISLITWIPILIILIAAIVGRRELPGSARQWYDFVLAAMPRLGTIGALLIFAMAASGVLADLGLAEDVEQVLGYFNAGPFLMVALTVLLIAIVSIPLTSTAALTAVGQVSFLSLVAVGVDPVIALVVPLVAASTEGSSPPSAPIFIASGIVQVKAEKTFVPLILFYLVPIILLACLVGWGILPIFVV
ncbi:MULTISPECIES: TRAP transporter large permease subunit [Nocardiopsis]|uniref:TRAP transporter large permease subunit n=1 Tax=Nocardiopsis alba TaxID=53437 RepID=A0A7K2INE9_9ACTN|nr:MULTISPECIES: TRAP transporter large permease subunit [Nocardiopsis]MEC3895467.1 TRAP transporter large permease subunit [Nocardiopsis sp. LDBS1602]MYR31367.1 TRAP transporter large permease subunit [Nocardiopsis alba]